MYRQENEFYLRNFAPLFFTILSGFGMQILSCNIILQNISFFIFYAANRLIFHKTSRLKYYYLKCGNYSELHSQKTVLHGSE